MLVAGDNVRHDGHEMPDLFGSLGQIFDNVTDLLYFSKFDIHLPESILDNFIFPRLFWSSTDGIKPGWSPG